jgi:nucleoid-associated protein YgaU
VTGRAFRLLKAAGALILLFGVIVGVPLLLAALRLVPHSVPSISELMASLEVRDDGQLVQVVLATGVWVCWALFTVSTAAEVIGLVRGRPAPLHPKLRIFQRPAAALVAAVAVGLTVVPAGAGAFASGTEDACPPLPVMAASSVVSAAAREDVGATVTQTASAYSAPEVPAPLASTAKTYEVQRRDTLWALAERYLGDPLRYPEIVELNATAVGPDNEIYPGTVLVLPSDATGLPPAEGSSEPAAANVTEEVTVEPGDTLWELSEEVTGSGQNWRQAWELNRGRTQPGGATFTDPSLIRPGWTLDIPRAADSPEPEPSSSPPSPPVPPPTPEPTPPPAGDEPTASVPAPATSAPASTETAAPSAESLPSQQSAHPTDDGASEVPVVAFAGGGLLLAGVSLTALLRYRRRQFRHRRPGRVISGTPTALLETERALQVAGNAGSADVRWLDQALRSLVQDQVDAEDARLPDVVAVCMTDDVLILVLASPALQAPKPWTVEDAGTRWSIRRDDPLSYREDQRTRFFAPFPALASVGHTAAGEHWLVDLERVGSVSLSGDSERCMNLARFLAAELAHNSWSEMLQVTMVGFGEELAAINPDRLTYTEDVDKAVATLAGRLESVTDAMRVAGTDVLSGRLHDIAGDTWAPQVLLIASMAAEDNAGLTEMLTAIQHQPARNAVAVVLVHDTDHADDVRWRMTIAAGVLRIPALGLELLAQQIPPEEAAQLAQVLAQASVTADRPIPSSHGDEPWDARADACGGLRAHPAGTSPPESSDSAGAEGSARSPTKSPLPMTRSVLPLPRQTYLDQAATTEDDVQALAPATDDGIRRQVESADPDLDADLADWTDPSCPRPKLTLLGPVQVRAQGSLPERNPRRQFYTEIVAYLATRPGGVTSDRYATAIWPNEADVVGKTKVRQSISVVRAWLGADPDTGVDYLPSGLTAAAAGRYRIDGILIDAELFRRLRVRGLARGVEGIADLSAALDLVTGRPFDVSAPRQGAAGGYSWLVDDARLDHEYAAMIVDVAHTVATHHLAAGQPELAAAAAEVALEAGSYEDVPLLDLVAACDAQDKRAQADAYVARILANHDAEVEEDLPPRTAEILFRRQWTDRTS